MSYEIDSKIVDSFEIYTGLAHYNLTDKAKKIERSSEFKTIYMEVMRELLGLTEDSQNALVQPDENDPPSPVFSEIGDVDDEKLRIFIEAYLRCRSGRSDVDVLPDAYKVCIGTSKGWIVISYRSLIVNSEFFTAREVVKRYEARHGDIHPPETRAELLGLQVQVFTSWLLPVELP